MSKTTGLKALALVIGNDQGLLDTPQEVNPNLKPNGELAMMPGERYEVIIDFSTVAGQTIEMRNTARTPYTAGAPPTATPRAGSSGSTSPPRRSWTTRSILPCSPHRPSGRPAWSV